LLKVLIVDDHQDTAHLITEILRTSTQARITTVLSGELAIKTLKVENYDLVICDFHMPEMNGHEVFLAIKDAGHDCQFLLFTNADLRILPKFNGTGFLGIVKKTDLEALIDHVAKLGNEKGAL